MGTCSAHRRRRLSLLRRAGCALVVASLVAAVLGAPAALGAGSAGGNAFSELTEKARTTTSTPTAPATRTRTTTGTESTTTTSTGSSSNNGRVLLFGLIAAGALLAGIAFLILRDARRVAPVPDGQLGGEGRSARDVAVMMRKRRAKAKAARRQRKRNR